MLAMSNESAAQRAERARNTGVPWRQSKVVGRLQRAVNAQALAVLETDRAVAACRQAGVTWDVIATTLGMKQPNAVAKYKPRIADLEQEG